MPNGHSNGNGFSLSRQQAEKFVTWGVRVLVTALMGLVLWNAGGIVDKQAVQDANHAALKDRVLRLEVQVQELTRRVGEKDEQIEDLRTLFISGQVRVAPPEQ